MGISAYCANRESPAQFENRIKPRVYVRRITSLFLAASHFPWIYLTDYQVNPLKGKRLYIL